MISSVLNRIVVVIVALVILAGAVITLLVATGASSADMFRGFQSQLQGAADASGGGAAAIIAVAAVIALGMLALLLLELIPLRKAVLLLISSTEEGITAIERESVCELAEKTAAVVHNVRDVRCSVRERAGGLLVSCRALVALGTNIPQVSAELQSKIKKDVEELTGLPVAEVDVKAKYESVEVKRLIVR